LPRRRRRSRGHRLHLHADSRRNPEAAPGVEGFRVKNFEPDSWMLHSYAAVQTWVQAIEKAGSFDLQAAIASLRSRQFDTVLGRIEFDQKNDLTVQN